MIMKKTSRKGLDCHIEQKNEGKQQQGVPFPIPQLDVKSENDQEVHLVVDKKGEMQNKI